MNSRLITSIAPCGPRFAFPRTRQLNSQPLVAPKTSISTWHWQRAVIGQQPFSRMKDQDKHSCHRLKMRPHRPPTRRRPSALKSEQINATLRGKPSIDSPLPADSLPHGLCLARQRVTRIRPSALGPGKPVEQQEPLVVPATVAVVPPAPSLAATSKVRSESHNLTYLYRLLSILRPDKMLDASTPASLVKQAYVVKQLSKDPKNDGSK